MSSHPHQVVNPPSTFETQKNHRLVKLNFVGLQFILEESFHERSSPTLDQIWQMLKGMMNGRWSAAWVKFSMGFLVGGINPFEKY